MKFPFWPNPKGYRDIELGLTRVYDLLERLDNPHKKLPPTIHIAGTNGKGSTLSFLRAIFEEGQYLVHSYTSPHLVFFNERIVLAGKNIDDEFLNECLLTCKEAASQHPQIDVTFFEGITVAAFLAFSRIKADILFLETGLGGRLDATNVIEKNLLSIITPISFDHTDFLGKTLAKIAYEKAGIIKKNCPVIAAKQKPSALATIEKQAKKLGSSLNIFGKDFDYKKNTTSIEVRIKNKFYDFPFPSLNGEHQIENATVAIVAALNQIKLPITIDQIKSALTKTIWPARLQKITSGKFIKKLPINCQLILDGSHNLQGATTVQKFLKSQKNIKKIVIFSMLEDKDCVGFLNKIKDETDILITLTIPDESKSRDKNEILKIAKNLKIDSISADDFDDAFRKINNLLAKKESLQHVLVIICGSLYLAGKFLEKNHFDLNFNAK